MAEVEMGTLYDFNKNSIKVTESRMSLKEIKTNISKIVFPYLKERTSQYYMLLCNEERDYTVFNIVGDKTSHENFEILCEELYECICARGNVYLIQRTEDNGAIEIWIEDLEVPDDANMYCYMFFPYDAAVIEIGQGGDINE